MKKLLSILTINTLTASIPAPLLANTVLERTKRDVSTLTSNLNNEYLPITENIFIPKDIVSFTVVGKGNIYYLNVDFFVLKQGTTTPTKINGINDKINDFVVAVDSKNTIYFGTTNGIYVLNDGSYTATKINGIDGYLTSIAVDSNDNIYFMSADGAFVLNHGETTPTKINGIDGYLTSIAVDSKNNVYFGTKGGAYKFLAVATNTTKIDGITNKFIIDGRDNIYFGAKGETFVLKQGETTPTKINGINGFKNIDIDSKNTIYFSTTNGIYVLNDGSYTATKINGIDGDIKSLVVDKYNNNIYLKKDNGIYFTTTVLDWVKQQSQFNLVDSTKNMTWTHPDSLSFDGELNIDIANPNIDKVVFDNVQQPQTNKHWTINVKPETAPRDHNLQVTFTLDGKQYTSQITVSMQAKIDLPIPPVQQSLSDLIKTTDLGNIINNNESNIFAAITQKNARIVDFSQITIDKKDNHSATLTAKNDSKSYVGLVSVKYNIVTATAVDLKINLQATSPTMQVHIDYVGQIDTSNITNPVNTFYYVNSESVITMVKRTNGSVITGVVYGCDDKWNKTSQSKTIDPTVGILLFGSQLATNDGKYVVELSDNLGHTNNIYLQIAPKQAVAKYFDTDNGKQFEIWAKSNGYDNIRGYGANKLNNLFDESKNWQKVASDSQFANAVADWFKTSGKLSSKKPLTKEQIVAQLKTKIPSSITIDRVNTSNYDLNKVSFVLNQSEFKPNDKVNIVVKYNDKQSNSFTLQIKDSNTPDNSKKSGLTGWVIVGIAVGSLLGALLLGWVLKITLIKKFILEPIRKKKAKAFAIKTKKDIAQMKLDDEEWEAKQRGDK